MQDKNGNNSKIFSFGERLRFAREKRGIGREELAHQLGLKDSSQISRYETDKGFPSIPGLQALGSALTVDIHWLVTGEPAPGVFRAADQYFEMNHRYLPYVSFKMEWLSVELDKNDKLFQELKDKKSLTGDEQFERDKLKLRIQEIRGWWKQLREDMRFLQESPFGGNSYDEVPTPIERIVTPELKKDES